MSRIFKAQISIVLALVIGISFAPTAHASPASAATTPGYAGDAYGTYAFVGNKILSGKSSLVVMGCTANVGYKRTNTASSVKYPAGGGSTISTGAINTSIEAVRLSTTSTASRAMSEVKNVNLLAGAITASVLKPVSSTIKDASGFKLSDAGSGFLDLKVLGERRSTVAPNTRVELPGIGYAILNEQIRQLTPYPALTINMVHVFVTALSSEFGKRGTQIIVAHARSAMRARRGLLDGFAYGSSAKKDSVAQYVSGRSFPQYMPCDGTDGEVLSNSGAGVNARGLFTTGKIVNTAQGTVGSVSAQGQLTSTVDTVNVVDGLVRAQTVKAVATASTPNGSTFNFSHEGSRFVNLQVRGFGGINDNVGPNTKLNIAGLGTLWLRRIVRTTHSIETRMIELIVTKENPYGIPVGMVIRVAVAHASVH